MNPQKYQKMTESFTNDYQQPCFSVSRYAFIYFTCCFLSCNAGWRVCCRFLVCSGDSWALRFTEAAVFPLEDGKASSTTMSSCCRKSLVCSSAVFYGNKKTDCFRLLLSVLQKGNKIILMHQDKSDIILLCTVA